MFERNLKKIASYNGPLAFLLRRIKRAPRPLSFVSVPLSTLALGVACDLTNSPDVVVLEPDIELIFDALHTPQWSNWLEREGTYLLYLNPNHQGLLERVVLFAMRKDLRIVSAFPAPDFFEEVQQISVDLASYLLDFEDFGARIVRHILCHARTWQKLYMLDHLPTPGPIQGQPVCIVGAGPSLLADIERLRDLQGRAWIFSGGSAIPALKKAGIAPDFLIVVDGLETQAMRAPHYADIDCPALVAPRAYPGALESIRGPRFHLSFEHPLLQRLEKVGGIKSDPIDLGWSLVTAAVAITKRASHVILLGCDLAFFEESGYVGDHFGKPKGTEITLPAKTGGVVRSLTKWRLERDFITAHAALGRYNAGAFGVDIPGWKNELPDLPLLDKSYLLPSPIQLSPIELDGDSNYLVNWVWDRIKYMALSFEELMTDQVARGPLVPLLRDEITRTLEKEFVDVAVG